MLDLETWGVRAGYAIRSIGAVQFDLGGNFGEQFYCNVSRESCVAAGLKIDPSTEDWWARQSAVARAALDVNPRSLHEAVVTFNAWFGKIDAPQLWAHGANFDPGIYEGAAIAIGMTVPWRFHNVRDTRTVFELFGFDIRDIPRDGTYHNARDDAHYQALCVVAALRKGRKPNLVVASESVFE